MRTEHNTRFCAFGMLSYYVTTALGGEMKQYSDYAMHVHCSHVTTPTNGTSKASVLPTGGTVFGVIERTGTRL